jgi:hypothetical protein
MAVPVVDVSASQLSAETANFSPIGLTRLTALLLSPALARIVAKPLVTRPETAAGGCRCAARAASVYRQQLAFSQVDGCFV